MVIEEVSAAPLPHPLNKTRLKTGADPEQVFRIEVPATDGLSPSTKTGPDPLPVAKALEERKGMSRRIKAPPDATAESASEGVHEGPDAQAKPGDSGPPAKAEPGERLQNKSSPPPPVITRLAPETEKP